MTSALAFPGFGAPAAGPEAPLDMLGACHTRVEKQCSTLERLVPHLQEHGSDLQARQAAQAVLRYFETSAVNHHADEEQDLFPALQANAHGVEAQRVDAITRRLCDDHRRFERLWQGLSEVLREVADGWPGTLDPTAVSEFVDRYRDHIDCEDHQLIPLARRLLDGEAQARIGAAMARRRGLPEPVREQAAQAAVQSGV